MGEKKQLEKQVKRLCARLVRTWGEMFELRRENAELRQEANIWTALAKSRAGMVDQCRQHKLALTEQLMDQRTARAKLEEQVKELEELEEALRARKVMVKPAEVPA